MKRRRGFSHWITTAVDLPRMLPESEVQAAYQELRFGERKAEAAEKLILGHIRLGLSKVAEFAVQSPNKIEEMASEVFDALIDGVWLIASGSIDHHGNVTGYLMRTVRGRLLRFVTRGDGILRVSLETYRKLKDLNKQIIIVGSGIENCIAQRNETEWKEVTEVVDKSIDQVQRQIRTRPGVVRRVVELRVEGLDDQEIGDCLELTRARIQQIRQKIKDAITENLQ